MAMHELLKPWFDIDGYKRTRLLEARYEVELAKRFLDEGLTRNAEVRHSRPLRHYWLPWP
ncbi:MAG: hypothetical protein ACP5GY_08460 [Vulcanisaeta sp.]